MDYKFLDCINLGTIIGLYRVATGKSLMYRLVDRLWKYASNHVRRKDSVLHDENKAEH